MMAMRLLEHTAAALIFALLPVTGVAQAKLSCKVQPTYLAEMRNCYRPLLVFSPSANDARLQRQEQILDNDADDMMDRFVLLVPIVPNPHHLPTPLDAPYVVLSQREMNAIRERFHVEPAKFEVVLLGEDLLAKLHGSAPVPSERLNALIDTMPSRKRERLRPHAN
jgi:Domain of unknown function (DUF4174)